MYLEKIVSQIIKHFGKDVTRFITSHSFIKSVDKATHDYENKWGRNSFDYSTNQKRLIYLENIVIELVKKIGFNPANFRNESFDDLITRCTLKFEEQQGRNPYDSKDFDYHENQKRLIYLEKIVSQTAFYIDPNSLDAINSDRFQDRIAHQLNIDLNQNDLNNSAV